MRKVLLFTLMTLVLSLTNAVVAQTTTLTAKSPIRFVVVRVQDALIVAPYVKKGVSKSITHEKIDFVIENDVLVVMSEGKLAAMGKFLPIDSKNSNSDFYGVGSKDSLFGPIDLKTLDLSEFHKAVEEDFKVNEAALKQAATYFEIDLSVQPGSLERMAAMGFYLNERALVFESDDPAIFFDLKGKTLDELPDSIKITLLGNGVVVIRDCATMTETYTFTPGATVAYRTKIKPGK